MYAKAHYELYNLYVKGGKLTFVECQEPCLVLCTHYLIIFYINAKAHSVLTVTLLSILFLCCVKSFSQNIPAVASLLKAEIRGGCLDHKQVHDSEPKTELRSLTRSCLVARNI